MFVFFWSFYLSRLSIALWRFSVFGSTCYVMTSRMAVGIALKPSVVTLSQSRWGRPRSVFLSLESRPHPLGPSCVRKPAASWTLGAVSWRPWLQCILSLGGLLGCQRWAGSGLPCELSCFASVRGWETRMCPPSSGSFPVGTPPVSSGCTVSSSWFFRPLNTAPVHCQSCRADRG